MINFGITLKNLIESYNIEVLEENIANCLTKIEIDRLGKEGISLDSNSDKLKIMPDGTFEYKDERVLYYIPKAYFTKRIGDAPSSLSRVHIVFCRTLKEQKKKGTFSQYKVTNRKDGKYHYRFNDGIVENQELLVCQNCLQQFYGTKYHNMDYEEFFNKGRQGKKSP